MDLFRYQGRHGINRDEPEGPTSCDDVWARLSCAAICAPSCRQATLETHVAVALGQAACRAGLRVRFFTAAELVSQLEKAQKQYTLDRHLGQLERAQLLICDELG